MPKKVYKSFNGNRRGRTDPKLYFDHDDRDVRMDDVSSHHSGNRPRVSFKNQARLGRDRSKLERCYRLGADDFVPNSSTSNSNNNSRQIVLRGRGRGSLMGGRRSPVSQRGSRLPGRINRPGPGPLAESNSYKVIIPYGKQYGKDFIITNLSTLIAPETFIPIMYSSTNEDAFFYVDNQKIANKLLNCDRRITATNGFKLVVKVRPYWPQFPVDGVLKEKLKVAMVKRYMQDTNALDLSRFHCDPELVDDYFCDLSRPTMLMTVLNIVADAIPNLEALNLDNNHLNIIERLNVLSKKFPNLKILYIGDNKIKEMNQTDVLKDLKLEELKLAGNPVCNKYRTRHDDYVRYIFVLTINLELPGFWLFFLDDSDVRKRFPKLLRLDGAELPKPILFDVDDGNIKLPLSQRIFSVNPQAQEIANQFMQQYFMIFDSDSRQPLLDAYHEQACFSLTLSSPASSYPKFNHYASDNRNLLKINDPARRRRLLRQGRLPVVSYISEMPKTQHYLNSFTMDIDLVTGTMMLITITGCFKERETRDQAIRYFDRIFTIVPEGSGYCIINEQLFMTPPTPAQEKQLLSQPAIPPPVQTAPSPGQTVITTPASTPIIGEPSNEIKQQMVVTLSEQSKMNLEWSLKCLQEVQWNFNTALAAFNDFNNAGKIPQDAFNK